MPTTLTSEPPTMVEIAEIFRFILGEPEVELTPHTTQDDLSRWDSMNHIALVVEAECRFGVMFEPAEIDAVHSVGDLIAAIRTKQIG